jgi:uncharacterized protein (TIGR00255 family)
MKSMTGFGYGEYRDESRQITLSLKAYNNRYLDVLVYLPPPLVALEQRFRDFLAARVQRGRVELSVKLSLIGGDRALPDTETVRSHVAALRQLAAAAGVRGRVRLSHLLRLEGLFRSEPSFDLEDVWQAVQPTLEAVTGDFESMRVREGENTRRDISGLLEAIADQIRAVEARAGVMEERIRETLRERFREVAGDAVEENRLLAETAVVLVKADVHEEINRLGSHVGHFRSFLEEDGPVGKKLDFLCQEMNREFNTIGAKSVLPEVDRSVVLLKDNLEKIREQLRNVE